MSDPTPAPTVTQLFVYGTLQPGRLRWRFLEPFTVGHRPASVPGRLFDTGLGWPAATFDLSDGHDVVPGTLVGLDGTRLAEALEVLDEVEGTASSLFDRVVVHTTAGEVAWAYERTDPSSSWLRIARWDRQDER